MGRLFSSIPVLLLLVGCGPVSQVSLSQPQLAGRQRNVSLSTEQTACDEAETVLRVLAEFPLPGATTGRPTYALYLRFPSDGESVDVGRGLRGFLVQTRGENAGLTPIVGGRIKQRSHPRSWDIDLKCEDGSWLRGQLRAKQDPQRLRRFEKREHAADIRILLESNPHATP